jgi:hypothetical protein
MPESMIIPDDWKAEASVQSFRPAPSQRGFRCDDPHELIALADIEVPLRRTGYPRDANGNPIGENGFDHDRMVRLLGGIRDNDPLPAICIEVADLGQRPYRVRCGMHRYHASLALGFSHVPAEIVERID